MATAIRKDTNAALIVPVNLQVAATAPVLLWKGRSQKNSMAKIFKRWQQKMLFYLTTLNLARFLTEEKPKLEEGTQDVQVVSAMDAWNHSDYLAWNYIMNGLADSLYNVYIEKQTTKELWESLDCKYKLKMPVSKSLLRAISSIIKWLI